MARRKKQSDEEQHRLGDFWLWYREERGEWCICWYDEAARTTRRRTTHVEGVESGEPPEAAIDALYNHYNSSHRPAAPAAADMLLERVLTDWLTESAAQNADPARAAICVEHWLAFFQAERAAGRLVRGPYVSDVTKSFCLAYTQSRQASGRSNATINRELAALRASLNHAQDESRIISAPTVASLKEKGPRNLIFSMEEVAALLEASLRLEERRHVHLFSMIMLSTHARADAVCEMNADEQIANGLIDFLRPGEMMTNKRRAVVPIVPTLAPWLVGRTGKLIQYRAPMIDPATGEPVLFTRETKSIKTCFSNILIEIGLCEQAKDDKGNLVWLEPRRKLGETDPRPRMVSIGSPNTLRHTHSTEMHRRGVPEAQIETAGGHLGTRTNSKNYRHIRPEYLTQWVDAVEDYWATLDGFTTAHRYEKSPRSIFDTSRHAGDRGK